MLCPFQRRQCPCLPSFAWRPLRTRVVLRCRRCVAHCAYALRGTHALRQPGPALSPLWATHSAHCRPGKCRFRQERTSFDGLNLFFFCLPSLQQRWLELDMLDSLQHVERLGCSGSRRVPARDLVTGLLLPTASEVADAFSSALPSGLRPASCNSRSPPRTCACKKKLGSSCVRLPAIAGAHTDMCNTKVKAFRSICHGSLLDVFCCGSAIRACDAGGKCQPALRLLVGMRHNDWLPQVFQLQFSNQRVLSWDAVLLHFRLTLHAGSCWTQVLLCLS